MNRLLCLFAAALTVATAAAEPPAVSPELAARLAQACTKQGAFGKHFGDKEVGELFANSALDANWGPFRTRMTRHTTKGTIIGVEAIADLSHTAADKNAVADLARRWRSAIEMEIDRSKRFAATLPNNLVTIYGTTRNITRGLTYMVSFDTDLDLVPTGVHLNCTNQDRVQATWNE